MDRRTTSNSLRLTNYVAPNYVVLILLLFGPPWGQMFVIDCVFGAVSFFNCRSDPDNFMPIGKIISWLDCTVESKAYLGECDVEQVLVRWWLCSCYCTYNFFSAAQRGPWPPHS